MINLCAVEWHFGLMEKLTDLESWLAGGEFTLQARTDLGTTRTPRRRFHAASRADELLDEGDFDGQNLWLHILVAVNVLADSEAAGCVQ